MGRPHLTAASRVWSMPSVCVESARVWQSVAVVDRGAREHIPFFQDGVASLCDGRHRNTVLVNVGCYILKKYM